MPHLLDLARRFVAAGGPSGLRGTVAATSNGYGMDAQGKLYFLATGDLCEPAPWLPVLSDPSWLGWGLDEVSRRGYDYCMDARPTSVSWLAIRRGPVPSEGGGSGVAADRPEALVSLLEATRTESAP